MPPVSTRLTAALGMVDAPTTSIDQRKPAIDSDGSVLKLRPFSVEIAGRKLLLPSVVNGQLLTGQQAIQHYLQTGEHLGAFKSIDAADRYGQMLESHFDKSPSQTMQPVASHVTMGRMMKIPSVGQ